MTKQPIAIKVGALALLLTLLAVGLLVWRKSVLEKRARWSDQAIENAIESRDYQAARAALAGIQDPQARSQSANVIDQKELADAIERRDGEVIRQSIDKDQNTNLPDDLREKADLVLAREALWSRDFAKSQKLQEKWKDSTLMPQSWRMLQVDRLMASAERDKAREMLLKEDWSGDMKTLRFARLALLEAGQPWKAVDLLNEGLKVNPREPELLSFRAQIFEAAGRIADARLDYVAAVFSMPANPLYRDALANFQMRIGEPSNAIDTWRDAAAETQVGIFAFKAWFWSKMLGVPISRPLPQLSQPGWKELLEEMSAMEKGVMITPTLDHCMSMLRELKDRPEILWLKSLETMRKKDWKTAAEKFDWGFPREANDLQRGLAPRLLVNLTAVAGGKARTAIKSDAIPATDENSHPYLVELDQWRNRPSRDNDEFEKWMAQPASLVAMLFAHGWYGAALDLAGGEDFTVEGELPSWFDYGYARCLIVRDGAAAARKWLEKRPVLSDAARLTLAETLLTEGNPEEGIKMLKELAQKKNPHASRAAWSAALAELDRSHVEAAKQIVDSNDELKDSVPGKEILARCALVKNQTEVALQIYRDLGDRSVDAMIYLSKQAFAEKNWTEARKWTLDLSKRFPSEPKFRENLLKIEAQESNQP